MKEGFDNGTNTGFRHDNSHLYFRACATWSFVSSSFFGVRRSDTGFIFDVGGSSAFTPDGMLNVVTGFLCSAVAFNFMKVMNPTLNFQVGNVASLPFDDTLISPIRSDVSALVDKAVRISRIDWNGSETSWDFGIFPLLEEEMQADRIADAFERWSKTCVGRAADLRQLEERNNRLFIEAYGLDDEMASGVPDDQITLHRSDREEDIQRLISYAIGCMMGRYSLDTRGLIYAHSGNQGFDPSQYKTFTADQDGIIPVTDTDWFPDDAANRVVEFIAVAFGAGGSRQGAEGSEDRNTADCPLPTAHSLLEENLKFVAESLGPKKGESRRDTIRRYLSQGFYKHHLSMYKKRPIYWLFSSGKQRAFECLVYLHRYNEGTLGRMRTEYVIPLQGKIEARIDQLADDIEAATSTSHRNKLQKERDKLVKQQTELHSFDEKLRHYADQRIELNLDDGVKVNYGKFGDLLADVKAVTGKKAEG